MRSQRRRNRNYPPDDINTDFGSPCLSHRRMDEGPVLNEVGHLMVLLHLLGLKTPREVLEGFVAPGKYIRPKL